jgi:hypothetical protein
VNDPSRGFVWTVCLTYVALALLYNALTPIGEAPDELGHAEYVRVLVEEHRLPGARDGLWQGHQAPLYYLVQAGWSGVIRAVSGCRIERDPLPNQVSLGFMRSPNFNVLVHGETERSPSWGCAEWSLHLLRLLSTALTVPLILLTLAILRDVASGSSPTAAVGVLFAALLPSHVFISAMLNNDALVNLLVVAGTFLVIRASLAVPASPPRWLPRSSWRRSRRRPSSPACTSSASPCFPSVSPAICALESSGEGAGSHGRSGSPIADPARPGACAEPRRVG